MLELPVYVIGFFVFCNWLMVREILWKAKIKTR